VKHLPIIALAGLGLVACSTSRPARQVVYLVDATASVPAEARAAAVSAIEQGVQSIQRGESVAILPLTGDVESETLGQVLRFKASQEREPYDADRRRLARDVRNQLASFLTSTRKPSSQTDVFGTFRLAAEEFLPEQPGERVLVCLTDFVQDDSQFDFAHDPRLAHPNSAAKLAGVLAKRSPSRFASVQAYLGSLQSLDLSRLSKTRRLAIQRFWIEYLAAQGASVHWATDGPGHLRDFLERPSTRFVDRQPKE
jgi:hypothetical protein